MKHKILVLYTGAALFFAAGSLLLAGHDELSCANCHVPHRSGDSSDPGAYGVALWNSFETADGLPTFELYSSETLDATDLSQPDGSSRLCLGCHDGSFSGSTMRDSVVFSAGDLAKAHPVSFTYDSALAAADGTLNDPQTAPSGFGGTVDEDLLDERHKVQCASCHDVHSTGLGTNHLRWEYDPAQGTEMMMCNVCHTR